MSVKKIWSVFSVNMESYTGPPYLSRMPSSVNSFLQDIISNAFVPQQSGELQLLSDQTVLTYGTDLASCVISATVRFRFWESFSQDMHAEVKKNGKVASVTKHQVI